MTKYASRIVLLPIVVGIGLNALLCIRDIPHPSFVLVRDAFLFNLLIVPLAFLVAGACGVWLRRRGLCGRRLFVLAWIYLCLAGALGALAVDTRFIEPYRLVVRRVTIESGKVDQPLRILHISDIQSASIGEYEERAFAKMRSLHPDLILHTGDLLQPQPPATTVSELPKLRRLFEELDPPLGIYGVNGNIDWRIKWVSAEALGGLVVLDNSRRTLKRGRTTIQLFGLSHPFSARPDKAPREIRPWLRDTDPSDLRILMGHSPDYAVSAKDLPIDLCLAGHTHGGQLWIPFIGAPFTSTSRIPRSWARGFRRIGKTRLNVSAGIGCEHALGLPSLRLNCPSEMTLITIVPAIENLAPASREGH